MHPFCMPKLMLFGDSITRRSADPELSFSFGSALVHDLQRKYDVVFRGYGGYNSAHAKYVLPQVLTKDIEVLVIFLGTNDAALTWQQVPIEQYKTNLEEMISYARVKLPEIKIVLVAPAMSDGKKAQEVLGMEFSNARTARYVLACKEVAEAKGTQFVNLWDAMAQDLGFKVDDYNNLGPNTPGLATSSISTEEYLPDGLHYSGKMYKLYYDKLTPVLYPLLKLDWLAFPEFTELENVKEEDFARIIISRRH
ncbi:isoamyl acetate-hydrolyzing esterase [Trichomonascus vanleenenianus]|uniref:SGNH/GDSL hydrolase family protein n=1 Tax=Trichomonascus vanleenenianus TaxID=2268995 RepID=UPI003EC95B90